MKNETTLELDQTKLPRTQYHYASLVLGQWGIRFGLDWSREYSAHILAISDQGQLRLSNFKWINESADFCELISRLRPNTLTNDILAVDFWITHNMIAHYWKDPQRNPQK